jgi:protein-S-isoprenylcysteine O-methyltransferase Ste14
MVSSSGTDPVANWYQGLARSALYERAINLVLGGLYLYWAGTAAIGLTRYIRNLPDGPSLLFPACSIAARIAVTCFLLLFAALVLTRVPAVRRTSGVRPRLYAVAGAFLPIVIVASPTTLDTTASNLLSAALIMIGNGLAIYALRYLGRSTSIMPEARRLVTRGPYALVRHPLYVAEEVAIIGILIQHLSALTVAIAAIHLGFQILRMRYEEGVLRETFPDYDSLMMAKPRLVPGVY